MSLILTQQAHLVFLKNNKFEKYPELKKTFKNIMSKLKCKVSFRHVKGHTNPDKPRNKANNFCDRNVRKHYDKVAL